MTPGQFHPRLARRRLAGRAFEALCVLMSVGALLTLGVLLWHIISSAWPLLRWEFLTADPSQLAPETSGIRPALWGSVWVICLTALFALPVGIGAAIYLEEYTRKGRLAAFIELNIANLAGVPSIVYGMLGLALFVRYLTLDRSVLSAALTMSLLILPVIIIASREAIRAVPKSLREAAFAVGATRWQTIWGHVLPAALPGMLTGIILALSRAIGETAPLLVIGVAGTIFTTPGETTGFWPNPLAGAAAALRDAFSVLPIQVFRWSQEATPDADDINRQLAAAAITVLLGVLFTLNGVAAGIRAWHQRAKPW